VSGQANPEGVGIDSNGPEFLMAFGIAHSPARRRADRFSSGFQSTKKLAVYNSDVQNAISTSLGSLGCALVQTTFGGFSLSAPETTPHPLCERTRPKLNVVVDQIARDSVSFGTLRARMAVGDELEAVGWRGERTSSPPIRILMPSRGNSNSLADSISRLGLKKLQTGTE
jgi:hypothetical protein